MSTLQWRDAILYAGWPILLVGSVVSFVQASRFYSRVRASVFGRLVLITLSGWLLTMYGLGIVATSYLLKFPEEAIVVVLPVFVVWLVTMIVVFFVVRSWNREAVKLNDLYLDLERLVRERTSTLEAERHKLENMNLILEERIKTKSDELQARINEMNKLNRLMVGREAAMERMRQTLDDLKARLDEEAEGSGERRPAA